MRVRGVAHTALFGSRALTIARCGSLTVTPLRCSPDGYRRNNGLFGSIVSKLSRLVEAGQEPLPDCLVFDA